MNSTSVSVQYEVQNKHWKPKTCSLQLVPYNRPRI